MTTRVLMTTVLQKRRAQWSLLPKAAVAAKAEVPSDNERLAKAPSPATRKIATVAGSQRTT